jgi:hypothetical protein
MVTVKARTGKPVEKFSGGYKTAKKSKFTEDSRAKTTLEGFAKGAKRAVENQQEKPFRRSNSYPVSGMSLRTARPGGGR